MRAHRILRRSLGEIGASGYDYRVLSALADLGELTHAQIGSATSLDRRDVSDAVRSLESDGLLIRGPHPSDARMTLVTISDEGAGRLADLDRTLGEIQAEVLGPLTGPERRELARLLGKLQP